MKALIVFCATASLALSACEGWSVRPYTNNPATPAPSRTPSIRTATPIILSPAVTLSPTETATAIAISQTPTSTETPFAATSTPTQAVSAGALKVDILGCDTGLDLVHGMGEVTNAYVTISNSTPADAADLCATLRGLDEGRAHPDKSKCLPSLPAGHQVTMKLTVDTTYKQDTPVQVDVNSGETLLVRAGAPACTAIGLLLPDVADLGVIKPIP